MSNKSNTGISTTKVLMHVQMAASIVPIFAHIALAIMAWMQNNWMMLTMIIPSIMMYIASLIPQIFQYISEKNSVQSVQQNQQIQLLNTTQSSNNLTYNQQTVESLPDTITPVSLETLLMRRNAISNTQHHWKEVLQIWLKNAGTYDTKNQSNSMKENLNTNIYNYLPNSKTKHLIAPLGISNNGYCYLDLINNGPHALVAGTTGSGKSVLLTTWCLALAFQYGPQQLRFVFMDFKGGATFDILSKLPHAMGNVGDLNLKHAIRALKGLELELDRRERLVAHHGCNNIAQVTPAEPSLLIVIDEFHALKDQLPDYMPRLIRIASVGRSLGMHIIAGTQNPLVQVSADMKANISINVCLRVRDGMQSQELLGTAHAARISSNTPGAAYYNIGEGVAALRCAQSSNPAHLVRAIQLAGRFCHHDHSPELFSKPLPSILSAKQLAEYSNNYKYKNSEQKISQSLRTQEFHTKHIIIGLQDDTIHLYPALLPIHLGNIAIIGSRKQGKTTILKIISKTLNLPIYSGKSLYEQNINNIYNENMPIIIDDADELLDPLNTRQTAIAFQKRLNSKQCPVIMSTSTSRYLRLPEQAPVRIIFPTGDIGTDTMLGIPSALSKSFDIEDYQLPGRCVLITPGSASLTQIVHLE